jgi:Ca-activated chloride channel family protein
VEKLSSAPDFAAPDLARLATLSAERGEQSRAQPGGAASFPEGAIRDALAAVSVGQNIDPKAADWPALRKRLEALLAPPPEEAQDQQSKKPQPQDKKQDQSNKPDGQKSPQEQQSSDQSDSQPQGQESPDQSQSSEPKSGASGEPSPGSESDPANKEASPSTPRPSGEKPLGDLSSSPKPEDAVQEADKKNASTAADQPPPESADEPTQQAGGVSASGRPAEAGANGDSASLDPALVVPQQRLDRVKDADAPARLFQLLQESETPPEERERRAAGAKQTW